MITCMSWHGNARPAQRGEVVRLIAFEGVVEEILETPLQNPSREANHLRGRLKVSTSYRIQLQDGRVITRKAGDFEKVESSDSVNVAHRKE